MDSYKDIAPVKGANDSTRISIGESAAAKMLSETGFVKAEPFYINPPASQKPEKKLLLEDYNKGFDGFGNFGQKPKGYTNDRVYRDFDKQLQDQLEGLKNGSGTKKEPTKVEEKPVQKAVPQAESKPGGAAEQALKASQILNDNWDSINVEGKKAISRPDIYAAARRDAADPVKGPAMAYLRDNFDVIASLYRGMFKSTNESISRDDLKFLSSLSLASVMDNYYHDKTNNYLKENFDAIDTDGSGTLSFEELSAREKNEDPKSLAANLLRYSLTRQQENYSDPEAAGYEYNSSMANPKDISRKDLDMSLDERLAKSREDIFVQNYYSMYGYVGYGVGFLGAAAVVVVGEELTGNTGAVMNRGIGYPILSGGAYLGGKVGSYFDKRASRNYFHKHQEANLQRIFEDHTGGF